MTKQQIEEIKRAKAALKTVKAQVQSPAQRKALTKAVNAAVSRIKRGQQ